MDNIDWKEKFIEVNCERLDLKMENKWLKKKIESLEIKLHPKKTFVVCEHYQEYKNYYPNADDSYVYLESSEQMRGMSNPDVLFLGNWIKRNDIFEIITMIKTSTI